MKKMSILVLAAAALFGSLYADEESINDEPVATTESTEETQEGVAVSLSNEEVSSSFLANDEEDEEEENERIA